MAPLLAGIVKVLLANGLPMIANAAVAKGAEWVEERTGVKLDPVGVPAQDMEKLREFQAQNELELRKLWVEDNKLVAGLAVQENEGVTKRWLGDMASDSWLSKNIRPMTLVWLVAVYTLFAVMSAFGRKVDEVYITMLGDWGQVIIGAYFGARMIEKVVGMIRGQKK